MKTSVTIFASVAVGLLLVSQGFAEKASALKPKQSKAGTLIIDEKFSESQLGKNWAIAKGDWSVSNGTIVGKEKEAQCRGGIRFSRENQETRHHRHVLRRRTDGAIRA